jgi:hypothetical protein
VKNLATPRPVFPTTYDAGIYCCGGAHVGVPLVLAFAETGLKVT